MITAEKVRIICGRCEITIPGHLRVEVSEHATARPLNLLPSRFENQTFLGNYGKVFSFDMTDESLRVELVIASLLEHNLNQQISHFHSFNSIRKVNIDESFGPSTFKPGTALPSVR